MLVLTRRTGDGMWWNATILMAVGQVHVHVVRLGITAPHREVALLESDPLPQTRAVINAAQDSTKTTDHPGSKQHG